MRKRLFISLISFGGIFSLHLTYWVWNNFRIASKWVQIEDINHFHLYFSHQEYFLGISYGLAASFTIYAVTKFRENHRRSVGGMVGGVTLTGILAVAGCFLIGCCGSPMMVVYLSLFGSSFLKFSKLLVLILTLTSVIIGYIWMEKKNKKDDRCCEIDGDS